MQCSNIRDRLALTLAVAASLICLPIATVDAQDRELDARYRAQILPIINGYCLECHGEDVSEAEIRFDTMASLAQARQNVSLWQKLIDVVDSRQMPPKDAKQIPDADRTQVLKWTKEFLTHEAKATAGDPGPVVLRRLNNAEFTYTLRDLTGIQDLDPAREFPVDSAAGEGFTNTGNALVMSPALVTKYLDAAKEVSRHMVLLPNRIRFSPKTTRDDWKNESLDQIRNFYNRYADTSGGESVNLQGVIFDTNQGGRLPLERYIEALLESREALRANNTSITELATQRKLNPKYLLGLWNLFEEDNTSPSQLIASIRQNWSRVGRGDSKIISDEIQRWQKTLWHFTSVGHIGKVNGPKAWQEPINPLANRTEIRTKLTPRGNDQDITVYLSIGDAGDGNQGDYAVIERPRLVMPGRPDLLLRDIKPVVSHLAAQRAIMLESAAACLQACEEAQANQGFQLEALARKHQVSANMLAAWLDYLGIRSEGEVQIPSLIRNKTEGSSGYDFIRGWVGDDALSVLANSSDQHVRIPGNMLPHSVAVHPSPTQSVAVGWKSPKPMELSISGFAQHAHPECGNGVAWAIELRRGNTRQQLATGIAHGPNRASIGPIDKIAVQSGDLISLVISPRDGNHSCDLTTIDLSLQSGEERWSLANEVSPNILANNPHADHSGRALWYCYSEPTGGSNASTIPTGSLLARWQATQDTQERTRLAQAIQSLLQSGGANLAENSPERALYRQLTTVGGPLMAALQSGLTNASGAQLEAQESDYGLAASTFGRQPNGTPIEPASICIQAPALLEIKLPAELASGAEFVFAGSLHPEIGREGSVQVQLLNEKPQGDGGLRNTSVANVETNGLWSSNNRSVSYATPVLVHDGTEARRRIESAFDEFRNWFPIALCYTKIVPVDEVVTLTLFHREDECLQRLMLNESERAQLNQMWDDLHFVTRDALTLVDAYEQLWQFATQDADPSAFEPLREPIMQRAAVFRQLLVDTEPIHVESVIQWIASANRKPMGDKQRADLRALYRVLREQELPHDDAIRLIFARAMVSPDFLYRIEYPKPGKLPSPVTDWELANRLSYFLWSSAPDEELRVLAAAGALHNDDQLRNQTQRMLRDPKVRRLATEFACQWLHIHDFANHDEKSERHFPTFNGLRGEMYEESILFFTDLFQNDRPFVDIFSADYTFLNQALAEHYGITGVSGPEWRRFEGVRQYHRGGILALATTLAKQSGASRTSPILRGNWLSEVVLGEKLPKPPKNVPVLAETAPEGMTERQMIERHSSDEACSKCHARIDPFGFSLESFDAIGRYRETDVAGLKIDTKTRLPDGTELSGLDGLRTYLTTNRSEAIAKQFHRKLLGYALGRSVQLSDEPLLSELNQATLQPSVGLQTIVERIVLSPQFRQIRGSGFVVVE